MNALDPAALECLTALADGGSFDRAAAQLSITQSAVSQRLRALETHLGCLLVVRSRPLRMTEAGQAVLRYARQLEALRADMTRELGHGQSQHERLPIAVNADSLATWVLPALDEVVRAGLHEGFGVELLVDDQDFTHDWLREGAVLGCVSTVSEPLRGCSTRTLGCMRYIAAASPEFVRHELPRGLNPGNFARLPWLVFNRKDDMASAWVAQAFGIRAARLVTRSVPSTEAHCRATVQGWGIGVMPEPMAAAWLERGELVQLHPEVVLDVMLHWHQWTLHVGETAEATLRAGALNRVGQALLAGAGRALRPAPV